MPKVYIKTYGCQMNEYDSACMVGALELKGFERVDDYRDADVVILETCSVRKKAEDKVIGFAGQVLKLKREKGKPFLVIAGCMAERLKEEFFKIFPDIDLVVGTRHIFEIDSLVEGLFNGGKKGAFCGNGKVNDFSVKGFYKSENAVSAFVTVIRGCSNFCSYCIVPFVRGREISRKIDDILDEVKRLVDRGIKEITFLGQNINAYGRDLNENVSFLNVLERAVDVEGLERIRFVTTHPKDTEEPLIEFMRDNDKIMPYLHMPFQSGSNKILKMMKRGYSIEEYMEKVFRFRDIYPELSFSADVIVGFPGESESDFEMSKNVIEKVRFDSTFIFKYSDRSGTLAEKFKDKVDENVIARRHKILLDLQNKITLEINKSMEGKRVKVLIEGISKSNKERLTGRTEENKIAVMDYDGSIKIGDIVHCVVVSGYNHTLYCKCIK